MNRHRRSCQEVIHGVWERWEAQVSQVSCFLSAGFLVPAVGFVAFDEDAVHAEIAAEFDIGEGIADHKAARCRDLWKLFLRLFEETGKRFAAVALPFVVGAKVEAVHVCSGDRQDSLHLRVDVFYVRSRIATESDTTLIGDDKNAETGSIEPCNCFWNAGQQFKMAPAGDVLAFGHFPVDYAVAVKKDSTESEAEIGGLCAVLGTGLSTVFWLDLHPAMIAIS